MWICVCMCDGVREREDRNIGKVMLIKHCYSVTGGIHEFLIAAVTNLPQIST